MKRGGESLGNRRFGSENGIEVNLTVIWRQRATLVSAHPEAWSPEMKIV